jgi:RHS repeat-associated protein
VQTFTYDSLNRLLTAQAAGGTGGTYAQETYGYDATSGLMASKAGVNYTYNSPGHVHAVSLAGTTIYSYDANRNQTVRDPSGSALYTLTYDAENRLMGVSGSATASFVYDGDGRRVKGTVAGVSTTYVGNYLEWKTDLTDMQVYYYAGGTRVAMRKGTDAPNWLLGDHLGSTAITANSSGGKLAEVRYKAWGEKRYTNGTTPTSFRYTGQRQEENLGGADGLYYYNARWVDPALGRFLSADTLIPQPGNVLAWDRYAYSYGNPVKYIDPDGHWPCSVSGLGLSCSFSTFGYGAIIDQVGKTLGVEDASEIASDVMASVGLGLDITAEIVDAAASTIVTAAIIEGGTGGAVITLPGGGTAVVTGGLGASVGWAIAEIGVRPMILAGNIIATVATITTLSSDVITGESGLEAAFTLGAADTEFSGHLSLGSASQVSTFASTAGWLSPLAYPSLAMQTSAVLGDLGVIVPPKINIRYDASMRRREINLRRVEDMME